MRYPPQVLYAARTMILMSKRLPREMKFRMDIVITATDTAKLMIRVKSTMPLSCSFSIAVWVVYKGKIRISTSVKK